VACEKMSLERDLSTPNPSCLELETRPFGPAADFSIAPPRCNSPISPLSVPKVLKKQKKKKFTLASGNFYWRPAIMQRNKIVIAFAVALSGAPRFASFFFFSSAEG